ncbi:MAG: dienelactone hydrolase family protein [Anaerolineae bacterium]|nr:dienelactone hydrolase family protein [Anaerolineae bacterium]
MPDLLSSAQLIADGPVVDTLGLVHRVRTPAEPGPHPTLVMVHGLQGDENVTWIFARSISPHWLIASPRAPFAAPEGYTWNDPGKQFNDGNAYQRGLDSLTRFVDGLATAYHADLSRLVLLGFSQGAALSYAYAAAHPVRGVAALSGFVPALIDNRLAALNGLPVLILHGTQDDRIPIEQARRDRKRLTAVGAQVIYHEDQVGHKVSAEGMRLLRHWLSERLAHTP